MTCTVCNESGFVSAWSIMHYLSGWMWRLIWMFATDDYLPWVNVLLFTAVALGFEMLENFESTGGPMWAWLGYDRTTYAGDSAVNSSADVLWSLVGWALARAVLLATGLTGKGLGVTLGVAGALFAVFLYLFRIERRVQGIGVSLKSEPARPAVLLAT